MSKSWNEIRKMMEEKFLCEKLQGRIQYFFAAYDDASDEHGRLAIRFDNDEIFQTADLRTGASRTDRDTVSIIEVLQVYRSMKPYDALRSENDLLRAAAVLDGRIDRRTLVKLADFYQQLPRRIHSIFEIRFMIEDIPVRNRSKILLSSDGNIGLYEASDDVLRDLDGLISEFDPQCYFTEADFVEFVKRKRGADAVRFVRNAGRYPKVEDEYKHLFWHNF